MNRLFPLVVLLALAVAPVIAAAPADQIVDHPEKLQYDKLNYKPPKPADYRHALKSGATAYVAESHEVPTFQMTIHFRAGTLYEDVQKAGVADMASHLMRNGGVEGLTAAEFDEQLALLAAETSVNIGLSKGTVSLFCKADFTNMNALMTFLARNCCAEESCFQVAS